MKTLWVLACLVLISCNDSNHKSGMDFFQGNFITDCQTLDGPLYARFYVEVVGKIESGAALVYATPDCSGEYTMKRLGGDFGDITEIEILVTVLELPAVAHMPKNYFVWKYVNSEGDTQHTLAYIGIEGLYSPLGPTDDADNAGPNWSDWLADTQIGAFAADYSIGTLFRRTDGLP